MNDVSYPSVKCLHPKRIVNPYTSESMVVPCGHCPACQTSKGSKLTLWCRMEAASNKHTVFVTLTYANRFVPRAQLVERPCSNPFDFDGQDIVLPTHDLVDKETGELLGEFQLTESQVSLLKKKVYLFGDIPYLRKKDLQDFLKRLRYYVSKKTSSKIRYFACGEYGPVHFRPHFHLLLFVNDSKILQTLEEDIHKSWQFGNCDVQLSQGAAASYVARYVNSFGNLPKIFRAHSTSPFSLHSQRLGFKILQDYREKVYASSVDEFIKRCLVVGSSAKEVFLWRSYYAYFFPKCRGFDQISACERSFAYRLYDKALSLFPECETVIDLARQTVFTLCMFDITHSYPKFLLRDKHVKDDFAYLSYFDEPDLHGYSLDSKEVVNWVNRVYHELLLSKHFLYFCCRHRTSFEIEHMIKRISEFYSRLDYLHLVSFFESQQHYYESNLCDNDDLLKDDFDNVFLPYFYNNVDYDMKEYQSSRIYNVVTSKSIDRFHSFIKHKQLNDMNNMFNF